ncbi:MAG: FAD-binding oxidoreductase [Methylibium sp.]|uniref:FAD-binding oxidoreductase n=1 Tax=Methylibium sp. TaxID=2067992 RepID=UPI00179BA1DD|nr:FAD-binding oxidoreductase [Methylibium sp.]MBA3596842.1 FAD-binding oxidoreductase [Methylibium sp.]
MTDTSAFDGLRSRLRGQLIEPDDADYEAARKVFNAMIDRYPRAIARCVDVADVMVAVDFPRERRLMLAVRCGGHNGGGLSTCDNGLVIDLSRMKGIRADPQTRTVHAQGGCTWGDIDHATHAFGLACPSGIISITGVGGLTLGGGIGHLSRRCGLTIDNLLGADLVLADGSFVSVGPQAHPDLYWAIRGGGGNFGVVTSFEFRLLPVDEVIAGPTVWPYERAAEVLRWYRDFIANAPRELNGFFTFLKIPPIPLFPDALHETIMCGVVWRWSGPADSADEVFAPVRAFGPPAHHAVGAMPYPALQSFFDPLYCTGHQWYWRADFIDGLSDAAIEQHVAHGRVPTALSTMHLYPIDGAVHDTGCHDTAFSYRTSKWAEVIVGVDPDPDKKTLITDWTRRYHDAMHGYGAGGTYVNFMMDEGQERVQATYRDNYARLAEVKRRYDPENLFHVNQNIRPTE